MFQLDLPDWCVYIKKFKKLVREDIDLIIYTLTVHKQAPVNTDGILAKLNKIHIPKIALQNYFRKGFGWPDTVRQVKEIMVGKSIRCTLTMFGDMVQGRNKYKIEKRRRTVRKVVRGR
ncbi:hypothetical protein O3G_MSEX000381 [Manduca sexta]|nr:hypothetical protein O3G_MSEX000381 [Manduca sexta]